MYMYFDNMSLVYNWQMVGHSSCVCSNIDMKAARYIRPNHLQLNAWYCQTFREMQVWICSLLPNHIQPKLKPERCKTPDSSVVVICTNIYYSSIWHQAKNQMIWPIARTVRSVKDVWLWTNWIKNKQQRILWISELELLRSKIFCSVSEFSVSISPNLKYIHKKGCGHWSQAPQIF